MTEGEADALFRRIAVLEARLAAKAAAADKKIAEIKAKTAEDTAAEKQEYDDLAAELSAYIGLHPERFTRPRMRQTEAGKYGLRKATKLEIEDEENVFAFSDLHGLSLYETRRAIDKKAVAAALADGFRVNGAKVITGDLAGFSVDKSVYENLLKG